MKIKQTTLLSLVLAMLVLSTSCGKSPSVNPNLPTPKSQAANLNQDLIPEESFSIYKWIKNHLLWATTVAVVASYAGLNEWRHYSLRKAIADIDTKATTAKTKSADAAEAAEQALNTANGIEDKASAALLSASNAVVQSHKTQKLAEEINDNLDKHIKVLNAHASKPKQLPPSGGKTTDQKTVDPKVIDAKDPNASN